MKETVKLVEASLRRVANSTVAWALAFSLLRLALGLVLLPLLLRCLSKTDLGMYYLFLNLSAITIVLDLGFSPTLGRFINYAMGGAQRLSAQGLGEIAATGSPSFSLLWELLFTGRIFYRYVALVAVILLGTFGSLLVGNKVGETTSPQITWAAWALCICAIAVETYLGFWNTFLRNVNQVLAATRIALFGYAVRLLVAASLLLCGGGLFSLPAASLLTSLIIGAASRRRCLQVLAVAPAPESVDWRSTLRILWPNSWRLGLYFGGIYLSTSANVLICSSVFGLAAEGKYGLSLQLVSIVSGLAVVWTSVKWPLIGQLIARQDIEAMRRVLWPRVWLQWATFLCLAAGAVLVAPPLILMISRDKDVLPVNWLILLMLNGLLEANCSTWSTFISLWNRLPMLWSTLATNAAALILNLILVHTPNAEVNVLVLGPLLAGAAFNNWFWPHYGAQSLQLSWTQFLGYGFGWQWTAVQKQPGKPTHG